VSFERILVPDDFSEPSLHALSHALGLALRFGSELHLLHAYGAPAAALSPYGRVFPTDLLEGLRETATGQIEKRAARLREAGARVQVHLSQRAPTEAISPLAEEIGAELVVMGTRGYSGLKQVLLGSVARHTVRHAPCPVMTASGPPPGEGPRAFRRILLPTDFSTAWGPARDLACRFAEEDAEIVVAHALYVPPEVRAKLGSDYDPTEREIARPLMERLDEVVRDLTSRGRTARGELLTGRPEQALVQAVTGLGADLVVMGTHGRSGLSHLLLGSVAEHVLRSAACPTVTVLPD